MSDDKLSVIWVTTTNSRYPIYVGQSILTHDFFSNHFPHFNDVLVVTDDRIEPIYMPRLAHAMGRKSLPTCVIKSGEQHKNIHTVQSIFEKLIDMNAHRDTTLIALGGGVVGDLGGFSASCYQRGIPYVQVPTTLLAQVDSSVGGKTGFNFLNEKNVIGSFYQPEAVLIDTQVIDSLPKRQYIAGLAEVVKCAMLGDSEFFHWLENNAKGVYSADKSLIKYVIKSCVEMKARIVGEDEREKGVRALLNLGHTFAHALESATNYGTFLHGEAVAIGLYCSALMSYQIGNLSRDALTRVDELLKALGLPTRIPKELEVETLIACMHRDKKVTQSTMNMILMHSVGDAYIKPVEKVSNIAEVLEAAKS